MIARITDSDGQLCRSSIARSNRNIIFGNVHYEMSKQPEYKSSYLVLWSSTVRPASLLWYLECGIWKRDSFSLSRCWNHLVFFNEIHEIIGTCWRKICKGSQSRNYYGSVSRLHLGWESDSDVAVATTALRLCLCSWGRSHLRSSTFFYQESPSNWVR